MVHYYCSSCGVANGAVTFCDTAPDTELNQDYEICNHCNGIETIKLGVPVEAYEDVNGE
jgi:hypothetical protein